MPINVTTLTDAWQDVVSLASLSVGDEYTLVALDGAIELWPDPAGAAVPTEGRGDVIHPGSDARAADRPTYEVTTGAKLWAKRGRSVSSATLLLTET